MNIIVTGNTGLLGRALTKRLLERGHYVYGLSRGLKENFKSFNSKKFKQLKVDLSRIESVKDAFKAITRKIDLVFHAATLHPSKIHPNLKYYMDINLVGATNLLNACNKKGIRNIIVSSSFSVYGRPEYLPVNENHPTRPMNYYALSKLHADFLFEFYSRVHKYNIIILRYDGIYGQGQSIAGFTEYLFNTFLKNQDIELFNNGKQVRDNVYVDDVVEAHLKAMKLINKTSFDIFNIGGGSPLSALKRSNIVKKILKTNSKIILSKKENKLMNYDIFLDIKKAKKILGYKPKRFNENVEKLLKEIGKDARAI